MTVQIAFDGTEITVADLDSRRPRGAGLTAAQREILSMARRSDGVRAVEAGEVVHAHRPGPGSDRRYWATDGSAAARRLLARGLLEQREPGGPYHAVLKPEESPRVECPGQTSIEDVL